MSLVRIDRHDRVAQVVLDRAERRNALDRALVAGIGAAATEVAADATIDVVVVRGEGAGFSSGIDAQTLPLLATPDGLREVRTAFIDAFERLAAVPKATIAQVHGFAIGAGFELALACDLRVIADDATLGLPETRMGVVPDVGGCGRLAALVGAGRAKELIMTSAMIDGTRAGALGIANRTAPAGELDAITRGLAGELLRCSAHANGLVKRMVDNAALPSHAADLDAEIAAQLSCIGTPEFRAAYEAFAAAPADNMKQTA